MAYYLQFDGVNDYVELTSAIALGADFEIDVTFRTGNNPSVQQWIISSWQQDASERSFALRLVSSNFQVLLSNDGLTTTALNLPSTVAANTLYAVNISKSGSSLSISANSGTPATATVFSGAVFSPSDPITFGARNTAIKQNFSNIQLQNVIFTKSSVITNIWSSSASNGTGSILPDTVGTNDGTLVNFPVDNSQWVFYSTGITITPLSINSSSISIDPVIQYAAIVNLLPSTINSASTSLNPTIQYSSILDLASSIINSNSQAPNPVITYTSALIILPQTINTASASLDPVIEYKAVINLTPNTINSLSVSINPFISTGQTQTVGNVTAGFADDLYSVKYKLSGITVNFKG